MCYTSKAVGPKAHNKTQYTLTLMIFWCFPLLLGFFFFFNFFFFCMWSFGHDLYSRLDLGQIWFCSSFLYGLKILVKKKKKVLSIVLLFGHDLYSLLFTLKHIFFLPVPCSSVGRFSSEGNWKREKGFGRWRWEI